MVLFVELGGGLGPVCVRGARFGVWPAANKIIAATKLSIALTNTPWCNKAYFLCFASNTFPFCALHLIHFLFVLCI